MAKKNITITLHPKELLYEIQNKTYLVGRGKESEQQGAYSQETDDSESLNHAKRCLDLALSRAKREIGEFASTGSVVSDNELMSDGMLARAVVLTLPMPTNYNDAATESLTQSIHRYVVMVAVSEWFNDVSASDAARYAAEAEKSLQAIREALLSRKRPERREHGIQDGTIIVELFLWLDNDKWNDNEIWTEHP